MTVTEIPGVAIAHDTIGTPTQVTIDLKEHPEAIPVLKEIGLIPKTQFDIDFENGMTLDELEKGLTNLVKEHYANNRKAASI